MERLDGGETLASLAVSYDGAGRPVLYTDQDGLAKWQTADSMGYPDGWNQLAYCNNLTIESVDFAGAETAVGFGSKVTYAYDSKGDFFHALLELEAQWKLYGGTIQAVQSNADAIWAKVINDDMEGFVTAANSPTISWFENSPDWIRLSHKGHDWKWIKE